MGLFDFFRRPKKSHDEVDWVSLLPKEIVEGFLHKIKINPQATNRDEIVEGIGEFGLEETNPIPTYGIPNNETYLLSLRTTNGNVLGYRRNGSLNVKNIQEPVDEYEIYNREGEVIAFLYFSPYHWKTSLKAPVGFYIDGLPKKAGVTATHPKIGFKEKSALERYQSDLKEEEQKKRKAKEREEKLRQERVSKPKEFQIFRKEKFKPDWELYRELLSKHKISTLYHFTDRSNIPSIKKHGALLSWHNCEINDIPIPMPGGNELSRKLDSAKGLQDFVRVSFTQNHPMMYVVPLRSRDNVILEIDPEIIYLNGTMYANMNATRNDANVGGALHDFAQLRFDLFSKPNHFGLSDADRPFYQAEILMPTKIHHRYIRNLHIIKD